ncbi:MAG: hypothetical protein [Anelloviridae sp.]|nr:MAG: hypothetical protein [Anelloviridae sp.]
MSLWKPPKYGPKRLELQWLNGCISSHDFICGCDEPAIHLLKVLKEKSGFDQKCLTYGDDHGTAGATTSDDLGIDQGDLELLFAEDDADG